MRIGIFTDTYYPQINGVATSTLTLRDNLEALGFETYVFTTTDPGRPKEEKRVYRAPSFQVGALGRLGLIYFPSIAAQIKALELDVIHTQTEFSLGILGSSAAKKLSIPRVHTMHTLYEDYTHFVVKIKPLETKAKPLARRFSAYFCNSADQVIVPTDKMKDLLIAYGVHKDIAVVPTGIDLSKFSGTHYSREAVNRQRFSLGIAAEDKVLVYIGRISKEKNLAEILMALKTFLPMHRNVKLLLVGDGPVKSDLEKLTGQLELQAQVIFAGAQPWDNIALFYKLGDVFVSASQSETQGLTYIEALAAGLPVIAREDRCLEGVVENGINGYTYYDQDQFIALLEQVLFEEKHMAQLSAAAYRSAHKLSAAAFAQTVAGLYTKISD